jgi:hypothetical protein
MKKIQSGTKPSRARAIDVSRETSSAEPVTAFSVTIGGEILDCRKKIAGDVSRETSPAKSLF